MSFVNRLCVKLFCKQVGEDKFGNKYFIGNAKNYLGHKKRYVIYNGIEDGSKVPAVWHAWLHYLSAELPSGTDQDNYEWQIDHIQNLTGSKMRYDPSKSDNIKLESYSRWKP